MSTKEFLHPKKEMKEAEEVLASKKCKEKILDKAIILARSSVLCDEDGTRRPGHSVYSLHN